MYAENSFRPGDWNRFRPTIFKISFIISMLACWIVINANFKVGEIVVFEPEFIEETLFTQETPRTKEKKKELPPPKPPKKKIDPPIIVEPDPEPETSFEEVLESRDEEEMTNEVSIDTTSYAVDAPAPKIELKEEIVEEEAPIRIAEQMPIFGNCDPFALDAVELRNCSDLALLTHIQKNLKYPSIARSNGIEGIVVVQFVVDKKGYVKDINVVRDIGGGCGSVSEKIISNLPQWRAGKQNGRPVAVFYTVPIKFELQ